jgi:biopolymer transport protein ExbB
MFPLPLLAQADTSEASLTLWQLILSAEWVLIPLGLISFLVVGLVFFNFFWLRPSQVASPSFTGVADRLLKEKNLEALEDVCERSGESAARVLGKVIRFARENPDVDLDGLQKIAEAEGSRQVARINQPTQLLMDLGVMAPMVGLLGTVIGILRAFGTLGSDATPMRTMILASGVSQALIATAIGLSVGLIAMLFYAWFRARVQSLVTYYESVLTELLIKTRCCLGGH